MILFYLILFVLAFQITQGYSGFNLNEWRAQMADMVPTNMHGRVVGEAEGGWLADMHHPEPVAGVFLAEEQHHLTSGNVNADARTRITSHVAPALGVVVGSEIVASVAVSRERTGQTLRFTDRDIEGNGRGRFVKETRIAQAQAQRWGLKK